MNMNALRAQMVLRGVKVGDLAVILGISKAALYDKLRGKTEFTRKEMQVLIDNLEINDPVAIFFTDKVS